MAMIGTLVLPGDEILRLDERVAAADDDSSVSEGEIKRQTAAVLLGPGLIQDQQRVQACKFGRLHHKAPRKYWVETRLRRYVPVQGETVVGIIVSKHAESYRVDVGGAFLGTLSALAFEGATKKNRPNLNVGALIYARLVVANKDMEPELVCVGETGRADGYGELTDGFMFECSLSLCNSLLSSSTPILGAIGQHFSYEICAGANGRVWIKAVTDSQTILISNSIKASEGLTPAECKTLVDGLVKLSHA